MTPTPDPRPPTPNIQRLKDYIRTECASNNLRWRVDDPKAQYDPLVRLSAIYGRIDDWAATLDTERAPREGDGLLWEVEVALHYAEDHQSVMPGDLITACTDGLCPRLVAAQGGRHGR